MTYISSVKGFRQELAVESPNQASIEGMRLRIIKLQAEDDQAQKISVKKLSRNWQDSDKISHHEGLPDVPEIIKPKLIGRHHDDLLEGYFGIQKM